MGSSEDLQKEEEKKLHAGVYSELSGNELTQTEAELYNNGVTPKQTSEELNAWEKIKKQ